MSDTGRFTLAELEASLERKSRGQSLGDQAEEWSGSLKLFLEHAWKDGMGMVASYVPGWHIDAICEHLEAVSAGYIRRLAICVPPGSTKSSIASVCWPVWDWTRHPSRRFITASYDRELAKEFSVKSRTLIESEWFQRRWGQKFHLKDDENTQMMYANTKRGHRRATSTAKGTGHHADIIVIDDPHDAQEVLSDRERQACIEWHDGTITTRFTDAAKGCEVIISQRLHERDLIGHVLDMERDRWTVLCLPERYEAKHPLVTPARVKLPNGRVLKGDPREVEGELLCPRRVGQKEHEDRWRNLSSFRAAGQLQQRPAAREGTILKRQHWRFFPPEWLEDSGLHHLPFFHTLVQSWDTAFKDRTVNDYVAGGLFGLIGADIYLLKTRVERMSLSATKQAIRDMTAYADRHWAAVAHRVLIEKQSNGIEIIAELQREIRGVTPINADISKIARAEAAEPALEAGNLKVPGVMAEDLPSFYNPATTPAFTQSLIEACATFPFGEFDDEVDMLTQVVRWSRGAGQRSHARIGRPRGIVRPYGAAVER